MNEKMKILIGVKRVIDPALTIQIRPDGSGVVTDGVKMVMNPFDEVALEEAIRMRESGLINGMVVEVIAVTIGDKVAEDVLRTAFAIGADRAIHVVTNECREPFCAARIFASLIKKESPGLVLMGRQATDDDAGQVPAMLAALLGFPQATSVSKITIDGERTTAIREVDGGIETLSVDLPAVISVDLRLNEPRRAKLPDIMKAKKKPIETLSPEILGVDMSPMTKILRVSSPPVRPKGIRAESIDEFISLLTERGVLL